MISDQERREVAAKLRGLDERIDGVPLMCTKQEHDAMALGAIRAVVGKGDIFHLLADLIDRPTCTVESEGEMNPWEEYEMELSCGDAVVWPADQSLPRYCPWCGARVVSE